MSGQDAEEKFTRIRIESIEYQSQPATVVYFEEVTKHVKVLQLQSKIIQKQNENQNLESYTSMMSHEFRTPLSTAIVFINILLQTVQTADCIKYL